MSRIQSSRFCSLSGIWPAYTGPKLLQASMAANRCLESWPGSGTISGMELKPSMPTSESIWLLWAALAQGVGFKM